MNDISGIELKEGDVVAFRKPKYSGLCLGKIIKIAKKQVRVKYMNTWNNPVGEIEDTVYYPEDVCKVDDQAALAFLLRSGL